MSSEIRAKNLAELFYESASKYGDKPAFGTRNHLKQFDTVSFQEVYDTGLALATGLIELGLKAREHVAVLSDNRKEWIITNYGIILCGAADVPRGTDVTDGDIRYILPHSDAKMVFVENETTLRKIEKNFENLPNITHVILMDEKSTIKNTELSFGEKVESYQKAQTVFNVIHLSELITKGKRLRGLGDKKVEERISTISPDDLFTIIYTSGTTGEPKGVMLTHKNMISQIRNIPMTIGPKDRFLSILPVWHSFERVFQMGTIAMGACQYYTNVRNIREDLSIVKPTFMASAPRLWENLYQAMQAKVESSSLVKKILFKAAYNSALPIQRSFHFFKGNLLDLKGRNLIQSLSFVILSIYRIIIFILPYFILDTMVLRKIRQVTGGKLRGTVSGGGSLPFHIDEFFNTIGIPVFEGYGLTETSPGLAFRTPKHLVVGSVGPLFPETEIQLKDIETGAILYPPKKGIKGEIYVRGPQIMKGYYKRPDVTAKVLSNDGWLNTGDLGIMTYNHTLKIVGRSKETIVLLNGENIEPVPIENKLIQSPLIDHVMVVGQDQKFLGALILPSLGVFLEYGSTYEELAKNKKVQERIEKEVKTIIRIENGFKSFEKIGEVRLLPKTFDVGDELSAKLSMKRHIITAKYQSLIDSMYMEKVKASVD
ncbi:long-chain fatty acid--CoA ligase [Leptospira congkakensis]|uniref:Long-chain fatty acid--CoA ligase n=2 Tax=Leptospira congkakensis TaxID=2484932 RepID=A0A4Z1A571_9LEPT|nr:long-chain fatty acid--CoA ligase [Leptospira congkakensis]TGL87123.1 long-chain fatty acid--CoA ligase [Leptospira congkakensis]TGL96691.1 long-chain fatty acid--CoA ligase [Leptospira congkakensis]TGL97540.1 long-chain fatty acid--CoA ligase [Leptospira congkakensis]